MAGRVNSLQSFGAADGPGIRYVVFLQGCPLRCACCHNPDTWQLSGGTEMEAPAIVEELLRYREYFGKEGGLTVSGGEPLMQPEFCLELFRLCGEKGIHCCLDTSGCILNNRVKELLAACDLVLLDIKYTSEEKYKSYVGGSFKSTMEFLEYLEENNIPTWLRQVLIPGKNDSEKELCELKRLANKYSCVKKLELLPFRKLCSVKYENMGIEFPLLQTEEPDPRHMEWAKGLILN